MGSRAWPPRSPPPELRYTLADPSLNATIVAVASGRTQSMTTPHGSVGLDGVGILIWLRFAWRAKARSRWYRFFCWAGRRSGGFLSAVPTINPPGDEIEKANLGKVEIKDKFRSRPHERGMVAENGKGRKEIGGREEAK